MPEMLRCTWPKWDHLRDRAMTCISVGLPPHTHSPESAVHPATTGNYDGTE